MDLGPYEYSVKASGKGYRSWLIVELSKYRKNGYNLELNKVQKIVETIHVTSLMIDDIEDNSDYRRNQLAAHKVFGVERTMNCAYMVLLKTYQEIVSLFPVDSLVPKWVLQDLVELHEGQGNELFWRETNTMPTLEQYLDATRKKTGSLFKMAAHLVLESCSFDFIMEKLGEWFQVWDDLQGSTRYSPSTQSKGGRFDDIEEGKWSFPLLIACHYKLPEYEKLVLFRQQKPKEISIHEEVWKICEESGCNKIVHEWLESNIVTVEKWISPLLDIWNVKTPLPNDNHTVNTITSMNATNVVLQRRKLFEEKGVDLSIIPCNGQLPLELVENVNCDRPIGWLQLPLSLAGPLSIRSISTSSIREVYIPLSTTEGGLVASIQRGCKALKQVNVYVESVGITRSPVISCESIEEAKKMIDWINNHYNEIKFHFESTSKHCQLVDIRPFQMARHVHLRFRAHSGNAMGMNMITIATENALQYIVKNNEFIKLGPISGNTCSDKKQTAINWALGRGQRVIVEAFIDDAIIETVLKTNRHDLYEIYLRKIVEGSALAGGIGNSQAHVANALSSFYLAAGQDIAQIVEGSMAITHMEKKENGIYTTMTLPCIEVGTIGGGTRLPIQRTCIENIAKAKTPIELAEVAGAAVLAGEISLLAALTAQSLGDIHRRLNRSKHVNK